MVVDVEPGAIDDGRPLDRAESEDGGRGTIDEEERVEGGLLELELNSSLPSVVLSRCWCCCCCCCELVPLSSIFGVLLIVAASALAIVGIALAAEVVVVVEADEDALVPPAAVLAAVGDIG